VKHSSYTYQKLFRALYGYTQEVYKSNGKNYKYHRKGVLSDYPYIRAGKNCVIIPSYAFQHLINFFKTGKNPAHHWTVKGDWKAVYYMDQKDVPEKAAGQAVEELIERTHIGKGAGRAALLNEIKRVDKKTANQDYLKLLVDSAEKITSQEWFAHASSHSARLGEFKRAVQALK